MMLASLFLLSLASQALAGVVPRQDTTDTAIVRSFTLPPFPISTGWLSPPFAKREPEPEPEPVAEPAAEPIAEEAAPKGKRGGGGVFGTSPDPTEVQITGFTYGGTGCPSNSVGSAISTDLTVMTLIFSDYVASIGPGIALTESRKNCQLNLNLEYPGGFQYSILSADYRGYADLDADVTGNQQSIYYFSGQSAQASTGTSWVGPYVADYELVDEATSASLVWSPCGANAMLNINSQISLTSTNASASGFLTTDSIDTSFVQQVYIQWQSCTT